MYDFKPHQKEVDEKLGWLIPEKWKNVNSRRDDKKHAVILQAPTGAGKTIMMANTLEKLATGSLNHGDMGQCCVLYVSASPDLNRQTMKKIEKSNPLLRGKMRLIDNDFNQSRLDAGTIYFVNTQKLGKNKTLTKGDNKDSQEYNFWDTWEDACRQSGYPVVLVIDESHQGMGGTSTTIAKRLIQGKDRKAPAPLVIGMSATPTKFNSVVEQTHILEKEIVEMKDVKDSGLIKDVINIHYQGEKKGSFETILLKTACKEYNKYESEWTSWCERNHQDKMTPILVVQVKDKITQQELVDYAHQISSFVDTIDTQNSFAHNIMDLGKVIDSQGIKIHQVDPSDVNDDDRIQVFFVKESASVGWDCPRAEVLLSYRSHSDDDYIIQMIGRMIRTPLAKTIEGSDILNSTSVILPYYDLDKVENINYRLSHGGIDGNDDSSSPSVSLNPIVVSCNNDHCREILSSLPSYTAPSTKSHSSLQRLNQVGLDLSQDGIIDFKSDVTLSVAKKIMALIVEMKEEVTDLVENDLKVVNTAVMSIDSQGNKLSKDKIEGNDFDKPSMEDYLDHAQKAFKKDNCKTAIKEYISSFDVSTEEAILVIAAASYINNLTEEVYYWADNKVDDWLSSKYKKEIKRKCLPERQALYNSYSKQSYDSQEITVALPDSYEVDTVRVVNSQQEELPVISGHQHLYTDSEGDYYHKLSDFETRVISKELDEEGVISFYRNPSSGDKSLKIPFVHNLQDKVFAPDFIVFTETSQGIMPSIIDPHGTYLEDSLDKLQGLAHYAEKHADSFLEIKAMSEEKNGVCLSLDLTEEEVREHVLSCASIEQAYNSEFSQEVKL